MLNFCGDPVGSLGMVCGRVVGIMHKDRVVVFVLFISSLVCSHFTHMFARLFAQSIAHFSPLLSDSFPPFTQLLFRKLQSI